MKILQTTLFFLACASATAHAQDTTRTRSAAEVIAMICGFAPLPRPGVIFGTVEIGGDTTPAANVRVTATWADSSLGARTSAQGGFRLCGVPVGAQVVLNATTEGALGAPYPVRVSANAPLLRADLAMDRVAGATFSGHVFVDSTRVPIIGAEVTLRDLGKTTLTDQNGVFQIPGIPTGEHRVAVRRIGFGPLETRLAFESGQTVDRTVFLKRAVLLDSVVSVAEAEFEENRRRGVGHFLTRKDLAKVGEASLGTVLNSVPGLRVATGRGGRAWVTNPRKQSLSGDSFRTGDGTDRFNGARLACYANVVLDNLPIYTGRRADDPLFDINTLRPDQIESIEYYASGAQIPVRYQAQGASACGVIVIRTRR